MKLSDKLMYGIKLFFSLSLVAMVFGLLGVPEEVTRPMMVGGVVIAVTLIIVYSVLAIWHREQSFWG